MAIFSRYFYLLLALFVLPGCVKDKPEEDPLPGHPGIVDEERVVYIANEGSLYNGNASLSYYNITQDLVFNDVYSQKNNQPLGDVFQSMTGIGDYLFLAINNSDKIVVINNTNFGYQATISVSKPRYMLKVSENTMYVSSLYHKDIHIVDYKTLEVTGKITLPYSNTEGLLVSGNKVYACCWDTACRSVYEIDIFTNQVTDSITIDGAAPQQALTDKNGKLWVLSGNVQKLAEAVITQIDPATKKTLRSFKLPAGADIMKPVWNPGRDTLYYLGVNYAGETSYNGVYRMAISASELPVQPFIAAQRLQYFWALAVDTLTNHIYIGDPKGFVQKGNVDIYSAAGTKIKSFQVGLGPSYFYFRP